MNNIAKLRRDALPCPDDLGLRSEYFEMGARMALNHLSVCPYSDCQEIIKPISIEYHSIYEDDESKCPCCGRTWVVSMEFVDEKD